MSTKYLDKENQWFREHLRELLEKHEGKWGVVHNQELIGIFDTFDEAYEYGLKKTQSEEILVKKIEKDEQTFQPPINVTLGLLNAKPLS